MAALENQQRNTRLPDVLLRSVLDHEVDEDRPQVRALWVAAQHLVEHAAASLRVPIAELQLGELGDHVHTWEGRGIKYGIQRLRRNE